MLSSPSIRLATCVRSKRLSLVLSRSFSSLQTRPRDLKYGSVCTTRIQPNFSNPNRSVWGNEHRPMPRGRHRPNKHWDPKYSKLRGAKTVKIELPDYDYLRSLKKDEQSPSELRAMMKERGVLPTEQYRENPTYVSCLGIVLDEYIPPEGDGKVSLVSKERAKQSLEGSGAFVKTKMAVRKIRQYDESFNPQSFVEEAQKIYIDAHNALAERNKEELHNLVTEKAFPEMMHNVERKSIIWKFIKSLEPPKVVHVRTQNLLTKDNYFGQVTVRFNTKQTLAVYDRFGRLIYGNPHVAKDVLEYVAFENHLSNLYGKWRIHGKIIPKWHKDKEGSTITHVISPEVEAEEPEEEPTENKDKENVDDEESEKIYDRFGKEITVSK